MSSPANNAADTSSSIRLKFVPFSSAIEAPFWVKYNRKKLETIQLSEEPLTLTASYGLAGSSATAAHWQVQESSLADTTPNHPAGAVLQNERVSCSGVLMGCNTVESFATLDKNELLRNHFLPSFLKGNVQALTSFVLLTYSDLKAHKVVYWFGFPALTVPLYATQPPVSLASFLKSADNSKNDTTDGFMETVQEMRLQQQSSTPTQGFPAYFVWDRQSETCTPLQEATVTSSIKDLVFCCLDPSPASNTASDTCAWPVRNLIAYLSFHWNLEERTVQVLTFRPGQLRRLDVNSTSTTTTANTVSSNVGDASWLWSIQVPTQQAYGGLENAKVTGWEFNARGTKPGPRSVNLQPLLDARHLAIQAADLNLKLMKWRMIPDLQVSKLQSQRVLILGAGTLGCNVARILMGWGIRKFTLVDYGKVGYSNPVRQPLFTLEDCKGGGVNKAVAAAKALKAIAADVDAVGVSLSIPMPGHAAENLKDSVERLDQLVQESDAIFLLTDTRESRWLPTVMAAAHNKLLMNAALGLDSWLVMRHGKGQGEHLGCYFCNDVVAPENSTKNRTLDQQCTVTRPGLAPIASAMAVEMYVSLLHHPLYKDAPAPTKAQTDFSPTMASSGTETDAAQATSTTLGVLPHQIRGSVVTYTLMSPTVPAFTHCTGCAKPVVDAYRVNGLDLVQKTCQSVNGQFLEELSGLTEFQAKANAQLQAMLDDDGDDGDDWGEN